MTFILLALFYIDRTTYCRLRKEILERKLFRPNKQLKGFYAFIEEPYASINPKQNDGFARHAYVNARREALVPPAPPASLRT